MAGLLAPLLIYRLSGSIATAGFYATISLLVATATQLAIGRLIDRRGPALPTQVLLVIVVGTTGLAAMSTSSLPLFFGSGVVLTAALWGLSTTIPSLIHEACDPTEHGRALGLVHFLWSVAMLVGTAMGGLLVGINSSLPFAVFALLNVTSIVIALSLGRRSLEVQESALSIGS
jgi:MFS family permease